MSPSPAPTAAEARASASIAPRRLPADERTRRHRIPVTTEARTALDLAPELRPHQLEQLLAMTPPRPIHALITRYPRRPGIPALRAALQAAPKLTRSRAERRILDAIRRAELPEPQTNVELAGYEVDFLWAEPHLVVEVDGHPFHSARPDRRRDLRRDARLGELGYTVLRLDADESASGDRPDRRRARPRYSLSSIRSITCGSTGRSPAPVWVPSIASTASMPSATSPKTVCLPSSQSAAPDGDDEELRAVGVRAGVGHRERAADDLVVVELVLEGVARAAGAGALGAAALDHEVGDHAVEGEPVVEARRRRACGSSRPSSGRRRRRTRR